MICNISIFFRIRYITVVTFFQRMFVFSFLSLLSGKIYLLHLIPPTSWKTVLTIFQFEPLNLNWTIEEIGSVSTWDFRLRAFSKIVNLSECYRFCDHLDKFLVSSNYRHLTIEINNKAPVYQCLLFSQQHWLPDNLPIYAFFMKILRTTWQFCKRSTQSLTYQED